LGYVPDFCTAEKDEAKVGKRGGFNADIPQPKGTDNQRKKTAYEH
jgi:hypothetical protein